MIEKIEYQHALIIGGTGMLYPATSEIAEKAKSVSVIARNKGQKQAGLKNINSISVDYHDLERLLYALAEATNIFGPVDLVISWIHSTAPTAPFVVAAFLAKAVPSLEFYDLLGSAIANPGCPEQLVHRAEQFNAIPNLNYHSVVLGFALDGGRSRWLSDSEISNGVLEAVSNKKPHHIVGTVDPWEKRP